MSIILDVVFAFVLTYLSFLLLSLGMAMSPVSRETNCSTTNGGRLDSADVTVLFAGMSAA